MFFSRMILARYLMRKVSGRSWLDFTTRTFCQTTPSGPWRWKTFWKKKSWKKGYNFLDFRFIVKRRGVENAWSPNWFFHVGLKWVYLLERTFYILSRRFLRADNPVWPEENFYYRAGNIFGFFLPVVQFNYWISFYSEDFKKMSKPNWNSNMRHFVGIFYHTCVSR